ncbi:MAG: hypothetical protein U0165_09145 [Polyangiaceae bacterium]
MVGREREHWGDGSTAQLARSFASAGAEPSLTPSLMSLNPMTALAIRRLRREGFFDH